EIGHNLGAGHDGDVPCASTSASEYLMAPRINGSNLLSQCSVEQMVAELATAPCLSAVTWSADLSLQVGSPAPPSTVFAGEPLDIPFVIANEGAAESRAFDLEIGGAAL